MKDTIDRMAPLMNKGYLFTICQSFSGRSGPYQCQVHQQTEEGGPIRFIDSNCGNSIASCMRRAVAELEDWLKDRETS